MPVTSRLALTGLGSSGWRREKARSRCVSAAARLAAVMAALVYRSMLSVRPWLIRRCIMSSEPITPVRRLLKSWAMPPVSWPTASIFCAWRNCSSA